MVSDFFVPFFKQRLTAAGPVGTSLSYREVPIRARFGHDERGSVAIEFALIAVVFLTILFGIMSYGFQFATRIALSYAVAEGGRTSVAWLNTSDAAQNPTSQAGVEAVMRDALRTYSPLVRPDDADISFNVGNTANGTSVEISIEYPTGNFAFLPFLPTPDEVMRVSTTYIVTDPDG
jgi:Flp pilus assembly pilin Flp